MRCVGHDFLLRLNNPDRFDVGKLRVLEPPVSVLSLPPVSNVASLVKHGDIFPCIKGVFPGLGHTMFAVHTLQLNGIGIRPELMDLLIEKRMISNMTDVFGAINGVQRESRLGVIQKFVVGAEKRETMDVIESTGETIGLSYLSRFHVTFDFVNNLFVLFSCRRIRQARASRFFRHDHSLSGWARSCQHSSEE